METNDPPQYGQNVVNLSPAHEKMSNVVSHEETHMQTTGPASPC